MSDPKDIKFRNTVNSKGITPEDAAKDLDEIAEKDLEDVAGGAEAPSGQSDHRSQASVPGLYLANWSEPEIK